LLLPRGIVGTFQHYRWMQRQKREVAANEAVPAPRPAE